MMKLYMRYFFSIYSFTSYDIFFTFRSIEAKHIDEFIGGIPAVYQ